MFTLYQRFIQQIKEEQIQKYNQKHIEYLYRCGKLQENNKRIVNNYVKSQQTKSYEVQERLVQQKKSTSSFVPIRGQNTLRGSQNFKNERSKDEVKFQNKTNQAQKSSRSFNERNQEKKQTKAQERTFNDERKQPAIQRLKQPVPAPKQPVDFQQAEEVQEIELVQCPQGCGRKFNPKALDRHIKICQKGEVKRKVFKVKVVDEQAQKLKKDEPVENQKKDKIPKWKKESNQIRNMVKKVESVNQGNQGGQTQKLQEPEQEDDRKLCPGCGRKFNQKAAERHIPSCLKRNKGHK